MPFAYPGGLKLTVDYTINEYSSCRAVLRRMLKILIVKDDAAERDSPLHLLESRFQELAKFRRAGDLETAFDYIDRGDVACILLDLQLLDADGRDPVATIHEKHPAIPIVLLTDASQESRANEALESGSAAAYLVKGSTTEAGIFQCVAGVLASRGPTLDLLAEGRSLPEASTKRPRNQAVIPIDVVVSGPPGIPSAVPSLPPHDELPTIEVPLDKVSRRIDRLEAHTEGLTRHLRALTWIVAVFIAMCVIWALLPG